MPVLLAQLPWGKIGALALAVFAVWFYGNSRYADGRDTERAKWTEAQGKADKEILRLNIALAKAPFAALEAYTEKISALEPIVLHDRTTVREFAATAQGATMCLPADRVFDIEATAAARGLEYTSAPESGNGVLQGNTAH